MSLRKGYLQLYTGNGKGKTTAAVGLGVRASGAGLRVVMIQFMKGRRYSEIDSIERLPRFEVFQHGRDEFVNKGDPERIDIDMARGGMDHALKVIGSGEYDLVILDEINVAIDFGLIDLDVVLRMLDSRPAHVEIVLTGRYASKELMEMADLITEMREIRHFYNSGVGARKGIEY